jgi:hypothetical protein
MNEKLEAVFKGKVVNKAHTINTGVDEDGRRGRPSIIQWHHKLSDIGPVKPTSISPQRSIT